MISSFRKRLWIHSSFFYLISKIQQVPPSRAELLDAAWRLDVAEQIPKYKGHCETSRVISGIYHDTMLLEKSRRVYRAAGMLNIPWPGAGRYRERAWNSISRKHVANIMIFLNS